jgi:aspartate-semialdehyde dehydrogenase
MKIVVVGATGMVGEVMLQVLAERNFISDADELILVASERSVGKEISLMETTNKCRFSYSRRMQPNIVSLREVKPH